MASLRAPNFPLEESFGGYLPVNYAPFTTAE
eukprot:CAMPEP_0174887406 /NCGR_PEP_ID=MMETSP0167-20121228/2644_1 /TAXON_ID=38298 /ORGANISM="Rhodella maculata, Strain CCMP736" /LENGTH=30 /DNA_ID= /DNA_START= /DNA_END= /DNA_ORIENTATION=